MKVLSNLLMVSLLLGTVYLLLNNTYMAAGITGILFMLQSISHDLQFNTLKYAARQGAEISAHIERTKAENKE